MPILTVTQVNRYTSIKLKNDAHLKNILVNGEVSSLKYSYSTGTYYFSLIDDNCRISACFFESYNKAKIFNINNGDSIIVLANAEIYEKSGIFQLIVKDIINNGIGVQKQDNISLKEKLQKKGYFDQKHKKEINPYPKKIGIVTSNSGAAVKDILKILEKKYPIAEVIIFDTIVQGVYAENSIINNLKKSDRAGLDTIILSRGGGAEEDLNVFNSEKIADVIYNLNTPVISAIGHEIDYTIADYTADMRAPTPTAAAEMCCNSIDAILSVIEKYSKSMSDTIEDKIKNYKLKLFFLESGLLKLDITNTINKNKILLFNLSNNLDILMKKAIDRKKQQIDSCQFLLEKERKEYLSNKEYYMIYKEERAVENIDHLASGDIIKILSIKDNKTREAIIK